jgi:hypothetical protein
MQIGNVGASPNVAAMMKTPEAAEGRGPDRDGDADDKTVKSATAPGVGSKVDVTA